MKPFRYCVYPKLREALQRSGLSRKEIAEKVGISANNVWWWLSGGNEHTIRTIQRMLDLTGLTFEEAFCRKVGQEHRKCGEDGEKQDGRSRSCWQYSSR